MDISTALPLNEPHEAQNWQVINDGVMGGRSSSAVRTSRSGLVFSGEISLANNGGFASIKRTNKPVKWDSDRPITLIVEGDGRHYQLRLYTRFLTGGAAYVAPFNTQNSQQLTYKFKATDFTAKWRGNTIDDAAPLDFKDIEQIGLMLVDKQAGQFKLQVCQLAQ